MIYIDVQKACADVELPSDADLQRWCKITLEENQHTEGLDIELTVRFVDEKEIQNLNKRFRSKDKSTNVLSFEDRLPPGISYSDLGIRQLGDIVICPTVVAAEAKEQKKVYLAHLTHIFVHGVLHLCGYDHVDDMDAKKMEAQEVKILSVLGLSSPYILARR